MLLVDKPAGPTSHDVVDRVRRLLDTRRVGHAGTLDPPATGLLVVLVGRATRLNRFVALLPKRYEGTVRFGFATTTDDATGEPLAPPDDGWRRADAAAVRSALAAIAASAEQLPPAVSARKVEGERAYQRARRGEAVELKPAPVRIDRIEMGRWEPGQEQLDITVACGAGTYIRAIARDLGRALGSAAHLAQLRRTAVGAWRVDEALPFDGLDPAAALAALRPMTEAVAHLPRVELGPGEAQRFRFGQRFAVTGADGFAAVFEGRELLGVALVDGGLLRPEVGLAS